MRLDPKARRQMILTAAIKVATEEDTLQITRVQVANEAQVAESLVSKYFSTMHQLKKAIVRHAKLTGDVPILALANMTPAYRVELPEHLRGYVAEHLRQKAGA